MAIQVNVTATNVTITNKNTLNVNQGEYNINDCEFTFSNEYENLIKRVVFSNVLDKKYVVEVDENNECIVPEIMLNFPGMIYLNVYAYARNEDGTLNLRYSPTPDSFVLQPGSYTPSANAVVSPEQAKDLIEEVNELITEANEAVARVNSIRFEIDSNGYLILTEND